MPISYTRLLLLSLLFCVSLMLSPAGAAATALTWSIHEISGEVHIQDATGQVVAGVSGLALSPPFMAQTGDDGRLVLGHGRDRVTVVSGTRFEVSEPRSSNGGLIDRVFQSLGSMLYQIEQRMQGGFEVETPYLVSVVKGTTFNILVTADASTVALMEGRLAVHTPDGKSRLTLEPGQAAVKSRNDERILLKDQQSLTTQMTGPIRVVDSTGPAGATRGEIDIGVGSMNLDTSLDTSGSAAAELETGATTVGVDAALHVGATPMIDVGDGAVSVSETAISLDADVPGIDVGAASISMGETSIDLGGAPQIEVGEISVGLGATSVGDLGLGATSVDLGEIFISGDAAPVIDVSETSVEIGEVTLGDISTPAAVMGASLSLDPSTGAAATVDLDLGDTPVVSLDVMVTDVTVDVAPEAVVTTVNDAVSDTTNTAVNIIRNLPGL